MRMMNMFIDLAVCSAIKSAVRDEVLDKEYIYFGEVGLTGEIRGTWGLDSVLSEAQRVGYKGAYIGNTSVRGKKELKISVVKNIKDI